MITKESNTVRKCCLYASDFHLEMILLPYIKERMNKSEFIIITQNDLSDTIKVLLDKVNIDNGQKEKILNLNWNTTTRENIDSMMDLIVNNRDINVIINGDSDYIKKVNQNIKLLDNRNLKIIECFNINDRNLDINNIKNNYEELLNTSKI